MPIAAALGRALLKPAKLPSMLSQTSVAPVRPTMRSAPLTWCRGSGPPRVRGVLPPRPAAWGGALVAVAGVGCLPQNGLEGGGVVFGPPAGARAGDFPFSAPAGQPPPRLARRCCLNRGVERQHVG